MGQNRLAWATDAMSLQPDLFLDSRSVVMRRADGRALVALREELRLLSSDLFTLYMAPRVVGYLG